MRRALAPLAALLLACCPRAPSVVEPPVGGDDVAGAPADAAPPEPPPPDAPPPAWVETTDALFDRVAQRTIADADGRALASAVVRGVAAQLGAPAEGDADPATLRARLLALAAAHPDGGGDDAVVLAAAAALAGALGEPGAAVVSAQALAAEAPKPIAPPPVEARIVRDVGVMKVRGFPAGDPLVEGLRTALAGFDRKKVRGLVFDLRGSQGRGAPAAAVSLLTNRGVLWRERARDGTTRDVERLGEIWPTERPIVLVVDETTGGAAELFAFVLQDLDIGYVVGQPTAGTLVVDDEAPLPGGAVLRYPDARVIGVVGDRPAELRRVTPTLLVADAAKALDAAIADARARVRKPRPR